MTKSMISLEFNEIEYVKKLTEEIGNILKQNLNNVNVKACMFKIDKKHGRTIDLDENFWRNLPSVLVSLSFEINKEYIDKNITVSINSLDEQKNIVHPKNGHMFKECHFGIDIFGKNPQERDKIGKEVFKILSSLKTEKAVVDFVLSNYDFYPDFEKPGKTQYGVYFRKMISCDVTVEHKIDEKERIDVSKEAEKKKLLAFCEDITGERFFNAIKSPEGKYVVAARYFVSDEKFEYDICFLDYKGKILWKRKIGAINDIIFLSGDALVICTSLTRKEMGEKFKAGGHIFCLNKNGEMLLNYKTFGSVECCDVSPKKDYFVAGTILPDRNVYCFDKKCNLLWKYKTNYHIVSLKISDDGEIISVYTGVNKFNKVFDISLNKEGKLII